MRYAVTRLILSDFRNYRQARLTPAADVVVLTGDNGAGKTNLLEAISFLSPGRGLRGARLGDVTRQGADAWAVAARAEGAAGAFEVGTGLGRRLAEGGDDDGGERRLVHLDGAPASGPAALGEVLRVAWLTPQMDRLFLEGPPGRRRFLDRLTLALHPAHGREVAAYERAMRERNRLLAEGPADPLWLTALEDRMAEHGVAVAAARLDAVERLQAAADAAGGAFPMADLVVEGAVETDLASVPAVEAEDRLKQRLKVARHRDAAAGRTGEGPHLSDLKARHRAKGMAAALCSTGEQKALLIGVVLAAARLSKIDDGAPPVLLLDEITAHLDERRRGALFDELQALGAQAWLSGTDPALFADLKGRADFFAVTAGTITNISD